MKMYQVEYQLRNDKGGQTFKATMSEGQFSNLERRLENGTADEIILSLDEIVK